PREGTFPPFRRASDNPIAIACLRLLTRRPDRPLLSFPRFILCIAPFTFFFALDPYRAMATPFARRIGRDRPRRFYARLQFVDDEMPRPGSDDPGRALCAVVSRCYGSVDRPPTLLPIRPITRTITPRTASSHPMFADMPATPLKPRTAA